MKYKVLFNDLSPMLFEADGYYVSRDGSLTLFQKSSVEEATNLQQLFAPIVTQSIASFPRGEWKTVYLQEGVESEQ